MKPTDRMIREELRREVANLPIPNDMWRQINRRLDQTPRLAPAPARSYLQQWRGVVAVAAAGLFWLSVVPAGHLADERAIRPVAVAQHEAAAIDDSSPDNATHRKVSRRYPPRSGGGVVTANGSRVPSLVQ